MRLFVGVEIPPEVRAGLGQVAEALSPRWPKARWIEAANQHVTLKFLGSTPHERLRAVEGVCRMAAYRLSAADVAGVRMGHFRSLRRSGRLCA